MTNKHESFTPFTDTEHEAIVSYGGSFQNDERMPLYSDREFNAAFRYLNLLTDITQARKTGLTTVEVEGRTQRLEIAERRRNELKKEFYDITAEELRSSNPKATPAEIRQRAHDTLASLMDTSYTKSGYER